MYVNMYVCMYIYVYIYMYKCMYIYEKMYICIYVFIKIRKNSQKKKTSLTTATKIDNIAQERTSRNIPCNSCVQSRVH